MRIFGNLFLILFLGDGGFSLMDELVPLLFHLTPFTAMRSLLAGVVIIMAPFVYLCLGIDRRLPKRIFLPMILFVFLYPLSVWFFPDLAEMRLYGLLVAALQVGVGMLPLWYFRSNGSPCLTMPREMFVTPFFSLKNSLVFSAANLFVAPLALLVFILFAANSFMAEYTSGFMRLDPCGLRMTEKFYRRGDQVVRLAAMIHMGTREYYDSLSGSISKGSTIVLAEGVTDNSNLLKSGIDYGKMASYLGLSSQKEMHLQGRVIEAEELKSPRLPMPGGEVHLFRADLDVSDFRPPTILLLNALGKQMEGSSSFVQGFLALNAWGEKNITPEMSEIITDDILHRRNLEVIGSLEKALVRYDTVVIPWGALHMKELEAEVLKKGFRLTEERERVSIDFRKMFLGRL